MERFAGSRVCSRETHLPKGNDGSSPAATGSSTRLTRRSNAHAPSVANHRLGGVSTLPHRRPRDAPRHRFPQHPSGRPEQRARAEHATGLRRKNHPKGDAHLFSELRPRQSITPLGRPRRKGTSAPDTDNRPNARGSAEQGQPKTHFDRTSGDPSAGYPLRCSLRAEPELVGRNRGPQFCCGLGIETQSATVV